jgi:large subunit ribosomal protein L13
MGMEDNVYIDATEQVAGRLATKIAKELLKGRRVFVVNSERSVVSGNRKYLFKTYKERVDRGDPYHGPFYPKTPDRILKRSVRGMLPKNPRGRDALKSLRIYRRKPEALEGKTFARYDDTKAKAGESYTDLGKISKRLGSKAR